MTRVEVRADPVRARTVLAGDVLRPRLLSAGPDEARVALVPTGALLLGGDVVTVDVVVGAGVRLAIVETAGTVAYPGPPAGWHVRVQVDRGGVLVWVGLPFVVCDRADVRRTAVIDLAAGARALVRETIVLGRVGETGGTLRQRTSVTLDDAELMVEDLDLSPGLRAAPGVLGEHRVLDTLAAFGFRPPAADGRGRLELAGPGALLRYLGREAHPSSFADDAATWGAAAADGVLSP